MQRTHILFFEIIQNHSSHCSVLYIYIYSNMQTAEQRIILRLVRFITNECLMWISVIFIVIINGSFMNCGAIRIFNCWFLVCIQCININRRGWREYRNVFCINLRLCEVSRLWFIYTYMCFFPWPPIHHILVLDDSETDGTVTLALLYEDEIKNYTMYKSHSIAGLRHFMSILKYFSPLSCRICVVRYLYSNL